MSNGSALDGSLPAPPLALSEEGEALNNISPPAGTVNAAPMAQEQSDTSNPEPSDTPKSSSTSSKNDSIQQHAVASPQTPIKPTPPIEPTASSTGESKRMAALQSRITTLETTLSTLTQKRTSLLHDLQLTQSTHAHPSPSSSSFPSSFPSNSVSSSTASFSTAAADHDQDQDQDQNNQTHLLTIARAIVHRHISLLHEYNEMRDVGQGLMGLLAEGRGVRIRDVQGEFGMDAKD